MTTQVSFFSCILKTTEKKYGIILIYNHFMLIKVFRCKYKKKIKKTFKQEKDYTRKTFKVNKYVVYKIPKYKILLH